MRIPSYDDLTPSIPDVSPGDVLASVARLLPVVEPVGAAAAEAAAAERERTPAPRSSGLPSESLFACLRSTRAPDVILEIAREFSPRIERHGSDSIVLDIAGLGRLLGSPATIGAELARMAARDHADIRIAVAPTQVAALLLTLSDAALTVVTTNPAAALAPLPLQVLQQLMAGVHGTTVLRKKTSDPERATRSPERPEGVEGFDVLRRWGLKTLGELAALPSADLSARMGQGGVALQQLARGVDPRPLVPDSDVPRYVERMELEWPIDSLEPLSFVLARLLEPMSSALERADRAAAALRLNLRLVDRTTHQRMLQLPAAMRDPRVLRTLLLLDLESHPPAEAIDIVTIEVDPAPGRVIQYSLLERAMPSAETLATLTARLGALVGDSRCGSPELLDTHRPDGFEMRRFNPGLGARGSGRSLPALRRFRPPVAVRVSMARGRPAHVAIDRRGMPGGQVLQAAGPWRSSGAWWDRENLPWDRDEWDVELSDGAVCRLYRDRETGTWFLDGVVD